MSLVHDHQADASIAGGPAAPGQDDREGHRQDQKKQPLCQAGEAHHGIFPNNRDNFTHAALRQTRSLPRRFMIHAAAPNSASPIASKAAIKGQISVKPPPPARIVKPSRPQELGVIRERTRNQAGIFSKLTKLPPKTPNDSMTADPTADTCPGVRARAVINSPQPTAPATAAATSAKTARGAPQWSRKS